MSHIPCAYPLTPEGNCSHHHDNVCQYDCGGCVDCMKPCHAPPCPPVTTARIEEVQIWPTTLADEAVRGITRTPWAPHITPEKRTPVYLLDGNLVLPRGLYEMAKSDPDFAHRLSVEWV